MSGFDKTILLSNAELNVVLHYNFITILSTENVENTQVKHRTELFSPKAQYNESAFVDK